MRWHQNIFCRRCTFFLLDDGIMQRLQPGIAQPRTDLFLHLVREVPCEEMCRGSGSTAGGSAAGVGK